MITNLQYAKIRTLLLRELQRVGTSLRDVRNLERVPVPAHDGRRSSVLRGEEHAAAPSNTKAVS